MMPPRSNGDEQKNSASPATAQSNHDSPDAQGAQDVLLQIPVAIAHLIDGDQSLHLATGPFSLTRLSHSGAGVAVFASVGDALQWPLASDSPATKLDPTHYFFTIPADGDDDSLHYGLTFVDTGCLPLLDQFLQQYSLFSVPQIVQGTDPKEENKEQTIFHTQPPAAFRDLILTHVDPAANPPSTVPHVNNNVSAGKGSSASSSLPSAEMERLIEQRSSAYWTTLAPNVEDYSSNIAKGIATHTGHVIKGMFWCSEATIQQLEQLGNYAKSHMKPSKNPSQISPRTIKNLRRVKKLSKMTEKVAKGVLGGVIKISGLASGSVLKSKAGKKLSKMIPGEVAIVSIDAFERVFDAVELAGKNVLNSTRVVTCGVVEHKYGEQAGEAANESLKTAGHVIGTAWTISKIRKAFQIKKT